jgi:hypothetical protein
MRSALLLALTALGAGLAAPSAAVTLASEVSFDNGGTHLAASDVQAALEEVDAALLGDVAHFSDLAFPEPVVDGAAHGLRWPLSTPAQTEFFVGVRASDQGGTLVEPENEFCLAYNFDDCTDVRIDATEHAWRWTWGSGAQSAPGDDVVFENDAVFTASDGTSWRPWAFHVNASDRRASLRFESAPGVRALTIEESGNVRIGPEAPGAASHRLEVIGDAFVEDDLHVDGDLVVSGSLVQGANPSLLLWGDSSDPAFDTADEVCAAAGLACFGGLEADGTPLASCQAAAAGSVVFARCRRP